MEKRIIKPTYIKTQINNNCVQNFGAVYGSLFPTGDCHVQMPNMSKSSIEDMTHDSQEYIQPSKVSGPRKKSFFRDENGDKDAERTKQEAQRILSVIHKHRLGGKPFDSSTQSTMNIIAATFWQRWVEKGWVPSPTESSYGAAFFRFLKEDCGIACNVDEKAFVRSIRAIIENGCYHNQDIHDWVAISFEKN